MGETVDPGLTTTSPPPLPTDSAESTSAESPAALECKNCGGATLYTPGKSATTCIQCASEFPIANDGTPGPEHDLATGLADPRAKGDGSVPATGGGTGVLDRELVCPTCGGAVGFVGTLTATRCPFCARPVTSDDVHAAPDRFPVDGIVPFGLDQASADKRVREWISKRRWAPNAYKKFASTGSFAGIYLPFFTFDADTVTDYEGSKGTDRTRTVTDGKGHLHTEHYIDWDHVEGRVWREIDDVPVTAESSVDPDRMRDLEPWPSDDAVAFRPEYLAGFLARRYDHSLQQCQVDARARMEELIDESIKADIGGDHQKISSKDTSWSKETYRHLLLPVYLLVVTFRSKPYQVAVNGVTGEVHGKRPFSWVKIGAVVLAAIVAAVVIGIYAWTHSSDSAASSTSTPLQQNLQPSEDLEQGQAADAPVTSTAQQCSDAVISYRFDTPDTYFPAVPACANLSATERTRIARELFAQDEISAARQALLALPRGASQRDICRATLVMSAARVAAHRNTASDTADAARACEGVSSATVNEMTDDVADEYLARRKQALADAP